MDEAKPVQSVIRGNNSRLIAEVAKLWIKPDDIVLDVTPGRLMWWAEFQPKHLICEEVPDFKVLPYPDASIDVIAYDPPFISTGSRETSTVPDLYDRYGLGRTRGWRATFDLIAAGMEEAARVLKPGGKLLAKCCNYVESGQVRWGHPHVIATAKKCGLVQVDEFIHYSGTGPQPKFNLDGTPRRQVHARRAHSFLCVFEG